MIFAMAVSPLSRPGLPSRHAPLIAKDYARASAGGIAADQTDTAI
jgi:hypothetical protein